MKITITDENIPSGDYCYVILSVSGNKIQTKVCPYWRGNIIDGEYVGHCDKLRVTSNMGDYNELWDQVKYCDINIGIEDEI